MFGSLFGRGGPALKPMQLSHLPRVLAIIQETDEDDATAAQGALSESRCAGMFVLMDRGEVIGVTGASPAEGSDDAMWLSWTYLTAARRGEGLGRFMIDELLRDLDKAGIRKIFIASSDYEEDGVSIYEDAQRFYKHLGAVEELRVPDYHARGEAQIVYGLENPRVEKTAGPPPEPLAGVAFAEPVRAPETEDVAALHWRESGPGVQGLDSAMRAAAGARAIVTALPQDVSDYAEGHLLAAGFKLVGALPDFHDVGFAQVWWMRDQSAAERAR